jgi:hypothetical protein
MAFNSCKVNPAHLFTRKCCKYSAFFCSVCVWDDDVYLPNGQSSESMRAYTIACVCMHHVLCAHIKRGHACHTADMPWLRCCSMRSGTVHNNLHYEIWIHVRHDAHFRVPICALMHTWQWRGSSRRATTASSWCSIYARLTRRVAMATTTSTCCTARYLASFTPGLEPRARSLIHFVTKNVTTVNITVIVTEATQGTRGFAVTATAYV